MGDFIEENMKGTFYLMGFLMAFVIFAVIFGMAAEENLYFEEPIFKICFFVGWFVIFIILEVWYILQNAKDDDLSCFLEFVGFNIFLMILAGLSNIILFGIVSVVREFDKIVNYLDKHPTILMVVMFIVIIFVLKYIVWTLFVKKKPKKKVKKCQ